MAQRGARSTLCMYAVVFHMSSCLHIKVVCTHMQCHIVTRLGHQQMHAHCIDRQKSASFYARRMGCMTCIRVIRTCGIDGVFASHYRRQCHRRSNQHRPLHSIHLIIVVHHHVATPRLTHQACILSVPTHLPLVTAFIAAFIAEGIVLVPLPSAGHRRHEVVPPSAIVVQHRRPTGGDWFTQPCCSCFGRLERAGACVHIVCMVVWCVVTRQNTQSTSIDGDKAHKHHYSTAETPTSRMRSMTAAVFFALRSDLISALVNASYSGLLRPLGARPSVVLMLCV